MPLGDPPRDGIGTPVGSGSLMVVSRWALHWYGNEQVVDRQQIERVEPAGCPCPVLSSSPGPYTPLDVDGGRILVGGDNESRLLDADGRILLRLPYPTAAGQLSGRDVALAVGAELRVFDAGTGALRSAWPLPDAAHHSCDLYGDPSCLRPWPRPRVVLGDLARGLAAYSFEGDVHVLRLADGTDADVAPGALPRFTDAGLVLADGARIRLLPWDVLQAALPRARSRRTASSTAR